MLSLKDFKISEVATNKILGGSGGGTETAGGSYFFGYGTSTCDWNPNNGSSCTYYFDDPERWRLVADCP